MTIAKDMTGASLQEIFDFVSQHLLTQNKASKNRYNNCFYRLHSAEGKLMCAAGVCIPDDVYTNKMEGNDINMVNIYYNLGYTVDQIDLLSSLQYMHDNYNPDSWKEQLVNVAKHRNLNYDANTH